jgi:stalled ribosome rescue protein Dom34
MRQRAIWIDHNEARIFDVEKDTFDEDTVRAANHHVHRHPKGQETRTHNHPDDEARFFDKVLAHLAGSEEILIMGPSMTKLHLLRYAQRQAPVVAACVVGLETADHPTDRELVAHIRHYFHDDRPRLGVVAPRAGA